MYVRARVICLRISPAAQEMLASVSDNERTNLHFTLAQQSMRVLDCGAKTVVNLQLELSVGLLWTENSGFGTCVTMDGCIS